MNETNLKCFNQEQKHGKRINVEGYKLCKYYFISD